MKRAIFVSSNGGYLPYLNAFFNSLEKHLQSPAPLVYLLYWDMPSDYLMACTSLLSFEVLPISINPADFTGVPFSNMEICKAGRYYYMREICLQENIEVACLMDADLMVVNPGFFHLFDMLEGTELLLGSNERYKWTVGPQFTYPDGRPLFNDHYQLWKFHCNTPLFLGKPWKDCWQRVLKRYMTIVYQVTEDHPKKGPTKVGDIYAWNYSVYLENMEDRVMLLPTSTTTQMHQTAYRKWTRLQKSNEYYHTYAGDPVLCLHGRCGTSGFGKFKDPGHIGASADVIKQINELFRQEWYDLNFRRTIKLTDYVAMKEIWQEWLDEKGWKI